MRPKKNCNMIMKNKLQKVDRFKTNMNNYQLKIDSRANKYMDYNKMKKN